MSVKTNTYVAGMGVHRLTICNYVG